jgi:hypothetical protein
LQKDLFRRGSNAGSMRHTVLTRERDTSGAASGSY